MLYLPALFLAIAISLSTLVLIRICGSNPTAAILEGFERQKGDREIALTVVRKLGNLVARIPLLRDMILFESMERKLHHAGFGISVYEWFGIWALCVAAGGVIFVLLWGGGVIPLLVSAAFPLLGFAMPKAFLDNKATVNKTEMRREFIIVAEKIALYCNIGVSPERAFRACVSNTFLGREIARLIQEVEMGMTMENALESFAARMDIQEAGDFSRSMANATRFGTEHLSVVMEKFVDDMRHARISKVEEVARKMESKMIIPVVCTVYPAALLILIGPLALIFARHALNIF